MNKKFSVIKINGFKGLLLAVFCIGCIIAGFLIFPGWICMHIWNYFAGFFLQAPVMHLVHGILLWCIIALSVYAINRGDLTISFGTASPLPPNEEKIKEVISKINERNAQILPLIKKLEESENITDNDDEKKETDESKIIK